MQLPLGLSSAAATTIGMEIGAGRIDRAKSYYKVNLQIAVVFIALSVGLFALIGEDVVSIFTSLETVQDTTSSVLLIFTIMLIPDSL